MNAVQARVYNGNLTGKVHLLCSNGACACGHTASERTELVPVDGPVTCKGCIRAQKRSLPTTVWVTVDRKPTAKLAAAIQATMAAQGYARVDGEDWGPEDSVWQIAYVSYPVIGE